MNMFKSLDKLFPTGADRRFGEVVSVSIRVFLGNVDLGEIDMKRKAWYVNASVNAFHMHRSLVRDLVDLLHGSDLTDRQVKRAKRLASLTVADAYIRNYTSDGLFQYTAYHMNIPFAGGVSVWRDNENQWSEVIDSGIGLREQIESGVCHAWPLAPLQFSSCAEGNLKK